MRSLEHRDRQLELLWFGLWAIRVASALDDDPRRTGRIAEALSEMADIEPGSEEQMWDYWAHRVLPILVSDLDPDLDDRMVEVTLRPWQTGPSQEEAVRRMAHIAWVMVRALASASGHDDIRGVSDLMHNLHGAPTNPEWDWMRWRAEAEDLLDRPSLRDTVMQLLRLSHEAEAAPPF